MTFAVETIVLDLPGVAAAFTRRLHEAGVPTTAERAARFADALTLVRPISRRRLYWTARAALVSDPTQVPAFDAVFGTVFGTRSDAPEHPVGDLERASAPPDQRPVDDREGDLSGAGATHHPPGATAPAPRGSRGEAEEVRDVPVPMVASDEELLRAKSFDALEPGELAQLYRLMTSLDVATPIRRTRRAERARRGEHVDLRRTLRGSLRTGGDPIRLARRRRRVVPRRIVMLCDISGSMEPYARAYLQFLAAATGKSTRGGGARTRGGSARGAGIRSGRAASGGPAAETFVFATRLTRLTHALATRSPERAIQRAAATAPDWSSGTRIGEALKEFNDRHGRRGMARGAVIVILSDGWERGDPALVGEQMERLARLAYRIVWVNPRAAAAGFSPQTGGMAAALAHCDALVSGHTLDALEEVVDAIAAPRGGESPFVPVPAEDEEWASATPVAGSSVAMPSGYGPSRGKTTPGWSL